MHTSHVRFWALSALFAAFVLVSGRAAYAQAEEHVSESEAESVFRSIEDIVSLLEQHNMSVVNVMDGPVVTLQPSMMPMQSFQVTVRASRAQPEAISVYIYEETEAARRAARQGEWGYLVSGRAIRELSRQPAVQYSSDPAPVFHADNLVIVLRSDDRRLRTAMRRAFGRPVR